MMGYSEMEVNIFITVKHDKKYVESVGYLLFVGLWPLCLVVKQVIYSLDKQPLWFVVNTRQNETLWLVVNTGQNEILS